MPACFDASFFVDDPATIEYRDGLFHVSQQIGNKRYETVMRPNTFLLFFRRAAEAARLHHFGGAQILEFPATDEDLAAGH